MRKIAGSGFSTPTTCESTTVAECGRIDRMAVLRQHIGDERVVEVEERVPDVEEDRPHRTYFNNTNNPRWLSMSLFWPEPSCVSVNTRNLPSGLAKPETVPCDPT